MDQIWSLLNNFIWHSPSCQIDRDVSPIFVQRQFFAQRQFLLKNCKNDLNGDLFGELGMPDLTTIYM
jgi:hypothetical protein